MTELETMIHFDETRHVRFEEPKTGDFRCKECVEICGLWDPLSYLGEDALGEEL